MLLLYPGELYRLLGASSYVLHIIFHILCSYWHINNHTFLFFFGLLLPIIDLLQQFEDYVKGIALQKRKGKKVTIRK